MKTYFVTSDIHSFYSIWRKALTDAGFEEDNKDHCLIILGDLFDRGKEAKKLYSFIRDFPKERRILVRGNHEDLLLELLKTGFPFERDYHNGTYNTLEQFTRGLRPLREKERKLELGLIDFDSEEEYYVALKAVKAQIHARLFQNKAIFEVRDWIKSDEWLDYYETPHYVFVHSWVPLLECGYLSTYDPDWRKAESQRWVNARWPAPYELYLKGFWKEELANGKTIVTGHWHTSDFYNHLDYAYDYDKWLDYSKSNPIYKSDKFPGLIGLDACTALTKTCNVFVLNEDKL